MRAMGESLAVGRVLVVVIWLSLWEYLGSGGEGKGGDIERVVVVVVVVRWAMDEKFVKDKREGLCSHFENISEGRRCMCYAE